MTAYVIRHPFKSYMRTASYGFGFTFLTNVSYGMVNTNPPISIYENPQSFIAFAMLKGCQHGLIWPSIPFSAFGDTKNFFALGSGMKQFADTLNKE